MTRRPSVLALAVLAFAPTLAAQRLVVHRAPGDSVILDASRLAALPRETVRGRDHGRDAIFEGTPLRAVLTLAGVRTDSLRGPSLADVLVAEAADGYRVAIALTELSPDLGARAMLVADRRDGAPLAATEGPLRLVVATDERQARWIRQLTTLRVVRLPVAR
jgi:hypothetical protein